MPLYEYQCRACGHGFEALVRPPAPPECPECRGQDLERLLSLFSVSSETTRGIALKAGRRHQAKATRDKAEEQREVIAKHDH